MSMTLFIILFITFNFIFMLCGAIANAVEARSLRIITDYNVNYIFHDYFNFLANLFFGKKYYVKVNGVWSVWRGRKKRNGNLIVRYGVDKHKWELPDYEYHRCKETDKDIIHTKIVDLNVRDLQSLNPKFRNRILRPNIGTYRRRLDNFVIEDMNRPIEDIDREIVRMLERIG